LNTNLARLALAGLLLSACGNSAATGSLLPRSADSGSAAPSAHEPIQPSASASSTAGPTPRSPGALARDGIAEVVTEDLVVRSLPEISSESIIAPVRLAHGQLLFVLDGPVAADGFDWYQAAPFDEFLSDIAWEGPRLGWVSAGRSGEAWIAPWTGECPEPSLDEIAVRSRFLRLACFGNDELTLDGILGDCDFTVPGVISPEWLGTVGCFLLAVDLDSSLGPRGLMLRQEGGTAQSTGQGFAVRVVGHFDDPAAQTCVEGPLPGEELSSTPPELVILNCRSEFVAIDIS
jgi:hypothetical protein